MELFIPLWPGARGDLAEAIRSKDGRAILGHPVWLTPGVLAEPDGIPIRQIKTIPTVDRYEGIVRFECWDKRNCARPKLVATVLIDCDTNTYHVEVEEYYRYKQLYMQLHTHGYAQIPHEAVAYTNYTHHGDWRYRDKI